MKYIIMRMGGQKLEPRYFVWDEASIELYQMIVDVANEVYSNKKSNAKMYIDGVEYASIDLSFYTNITLEKIGTIELPEKFDKTEIKFQQPEIKYFNDEDLAYIKSDGHVET